MTAAEKYEHGNFTGLAQNYSKYRPAYSEVVLDAIVAMSKKPFIDVDFVDVGSGTGIWGRQVNNRGCRTIAIEPNDDMRAFGKVDSIGSNIKWLKGDGENTGLPRESCDLLSMASSFHWVDFELGVKEFARVLRPGGRFLALWNPRLIEANPLLVEIEAYLYNISPDIKRVSSGRSGVTDTLFQRLESSDLFNNVIYLEGRHTVKQTPEQYVGVWKSVNDVRHQAGEKAFAEFIKYVEDKVSNMQFIETTYLTRAWSAERF